MKIFYLILCYIYLSCLLPCFVVSMNNMAKFNAWVWQASSRMDLEERRSKRSLGEKAALTKSSWAQCCPGRARVSSSGVGTLNSQGFLPLPKHSPFSSTSWLCQCISCNQTAILWFLPIQTLPIFRVTFKMHPHLWCLLSFLLPTLSGEWFSPPPMNAWRLGSFHD